jgi:hypothetical protein
MNSSIGIGVPWFLYGEHWFGKLGQISLWPYLAINLDQLTILADPGSLDALNAFKYFIQQHLMLSLVEIFM